MYHQKELENYHGYPVCVRYCTSYYGCKVTKYKVRTKIDKIPHHETDYKILLSKNNTFYWDFKQESIPADYG